MAGLRSGTRNLSFNVLTTAASFFDDDDIALFHRSSSGSPIDNNEHPKTNRRKRRNKKRKTKNEFELNRGDVSSGCNYSCVETITTDVEYGEVEQDRVCTVNSDLPNVFRINEDVNKDKSSDTSTEIGSELMKARVEMDVNGHGHVVRKQEKDESLDLRQVNAEEELNQKFSVETSPVKYFMEEMYGGNSLRSTTSLADEEERQRLYDTIFHMPWRCELLIDVGFFVCLDSFLSLLTIMPMRILTISCRLLKTRQLKITSTAELSDFGCSLIMTCGAFLLQQTDISLIYHMIRGQGTIKLYVVYNVLEIFDRLCQNFGGDVLQTLFNSAHGLANCSSETRTYWLWRFISDEALAVVSIIVHSFILLAQAITLSTCMVAHNNALFALLVSNNFTEIKSDVFKRFSEDNIRNLVYSDSIERFHISAFLIFILAQNILEAEGAWFGNFLYTLNIRQGNAKKYLTFVPLAPACVVIRALSPVYADQLPTGPILWTLFWILILMVLTFVMLTSFKVMIGMALHKHSTWYIKRCLGTKLHSD